MPLYMSIRVEVVPEVETGAETAPADESWPFW
jgi:hypothetical protein